MKIQIANKQKIRLVNSENGGSVGVNKKIEKILSQDSYSYSRYLMVCAGHSTSLARKKELIPYGISPQQSQIIFSLYYFKKTSLAELSRHLDRGINTISNQMTMLEKDGLVKKTRETPKSTLLSFELTEKGLDIFNFATKKSKVDRAIMSVLSEEERQQFISMLKRILGECEKVTNSLDSHGKINNARNSS